MADKIRGVFCVTVIVSVLGLGNGKGATFKNFTALKQEWVECGYPPAETYNKSLSAYTNSFSKCFDDKAGGGVEKICDLYQQEVDRLCHTSEPTDLKQTASETKEMLNANLHICGLAERVKLSPRIEEHLQGSRCAPACSSLGAPDVCRLLILLCITGPDSFFEDIPTYDPTTAPPSTVQTTTSTAAATTTTAAPTVTKKSIPNKPTADPTATTTAPPTTARTAAPTTNATAAPTATTTAAQVVLQTTKGLGKYLLYVGIVLAACVPLFIIYRRRNKILTCLQENRETSGSPEDGKRRYRKLPHFERDVPSLDGVDQAKSYIY
ncbi:uncharacterized protein LOC124132563 isoform X3 [Haliotis rufescens]|uniref:uncharacterized protein LOC124132563 isoform X3 n=1 Tax=Haliotis rufescens TaxID=6454 RepID=UPI00201EBF7E|nr:uncharacterized protein LOC124132563 isoform X3 [Haliotis rufescens]